MERRQHPNRPPRPPRPQRPPVSEHPQKEEKSTSGEKKKSPVLIIIIALLLLGGGAAFIIYSMKNKPKKVEVVVKEAPKSVIKPKTKMIDISEYDMYEMDKGNYLYSLSKQLYNDPKFWPLLYQANYTKLNNPDFVPFKAQLMVYELDSTATELTSSDSLMLSEAYQAVAIAYQKFGNGPQADAYAERAKEFIPIN